MLQSSCFYVLLLNNFHQKLFLLLCASCYYFESLLQWFYNLQILTLMCFFHGMFHLVRSNTHSNILLAISHTYEEYYFLGKYPNVIIILIFSKGCYKYLVWIFGLKFLIWQETVSNLMLYTWLLIFSINCFSLWG